MDLRVAGRMGTVFANIPRAQLINHTVANKEAIVTETGCLATWTPLHSTGRVPENTVIVQRDENLPTIDWSSPNNIPISASEFDGCWEQALVLLNESPRVYITDRVVGADVRYALPVRTITNYSLTALFTDNMFRPVPDDIAKSVFASEGFTLLVLPYQVPSGYDRIVAMDMERRRGLVMGSAYMGSVKKLIFTVMNYYLPMIGILPLHCSANEGVKGDTALFLGLSGTGKTTLFTDPARRILGDDEHGWSDHGIANFEYGCYAKMIDIKPESEPELYYAVMTPRPENGTIVENAMVYPNGRFDFADRRLTQNSRASFPLRYLPNVKESSVAGHPETIFFLTADAYGVLPPLARLGPQQAMLWFLMGYTSKLAGTEMGLGEPTATFSRFFGQPFMPGNPDTYVAMLGEKMRRHKTNIYLVNTGWSGGPYGIGERISLSLTRRMVSAAINGELSDDYWRDPLFHLDVPVHCPGVPDAILRPRDTWADQQAYDRQARRLASEFSAHFDQAYGNKGIDQQITAQCPGK